MRDDKKPPGIQSDLDYYSLDPENTDPKRVKLEREKAKKLRKSQWWLNQLQQGLCHYCQKKVPSNQLTMDHVVPIARGGTSSRGNIVPACVNCNREKKLHTPVDQILNEMSRKRPNE